MPNAVFYDYPWDGLHSSKCWFTTYILYLESRTELYKTMFLFSRTDISLKQVLTDIQIQGSTRYTVPSVPATATGLGIRIRPATHSLTSMKMTNLQ
jgi:hypothetical protein